MRWVDGQALAGRRIDPTITDSTAAKYKSMDVAALDHRQLKAAIKRCGRDRMPGIFGHARRHRLL